MKEGIKTNNQKMQSVTITAARNKSFIGKVGIITSPCSLCEGMGVLDGFGGGNRTECHKCNGTGKANKETPRPKLCENKSK